MKKLVAAILIAISATVGVGAATSATGTSVLAGGDNHWCC